jgi:1-acyl-sn-glycerol-3-phosphate acyltransferase
MRTDAGPGARPGPRPPITTELTHELTPLILGTAFVCRVLTSAVTRVRLVGAVDDIPREGPVIIAANHASNLDPVVIGSWLVPTLGRRMQWLGKRELFDWPLLGYLARHGGVHPVDRGAADVEAFRLAKRILDGGHPLFVFPEGTRSPDGTLQPARDGVALLAQRTGAPIVPIGIAGSHAVWPRGQKLPRPGGRVTVRVGPAFRLADALPPDTDRKAAKGLATELIMRRIAEQLPPEQRGAYGSAEGVSTLPVR